jgi:hypothetical protein
MAEPARARRLTDEEGRRLQRIVRPGKHGTIRVRQALIIMASASGTPVPAIARLVAAHEDTVHDAIHRFNECGLRALDPNWAGGRPRRISDDDGVHRRDGPGAADEDSAVRLARTSTSTTTSRCAPAWHAALRPRPAD